MSKYNAKRVGVDGRKFDSRAEAEHYLLLKDRQNRGEISGLECQRKFTIVEPQTYGRHRLQAVNYIADFVYYEKGHMIVEDVKGYKRGTAYQLFTVKKKLMLQKYGIWVREV